MRTDEIDNIIAIAESGYSDLAKEYNIDGFVGFMEEVYIQNEWTLPADEDFESYWEAANGLDGYSDEWQR